MPPKKLTKPDVMMKDKKKAKKLYCSFCGKSQQKVSRLIAGPAVYICDECIDLSFEIIDEEIGGSKIKRTIEFKPEQTQAGLSILNYFSRIVRQKYPDVNVKVKIQQDIDFVHMEIQTPEGEIEKIKQTLDQYGLVVLGQISPNELLSNPMHIMELKNKLEMSAMELRMTKELLENTKSMQNERIESLEEKVSQLHALVGSGVTESSELHTIFKALIRVNSKGSEIEKAVSTLIKNISICAYKEDNKEANEAIKVIVDKEPGLFNHLQYVVKGTICGAGGSVAGSWITAFINALPK